MEHATFDRIVTALASATTRRAGLAAAVGAAFGRSAAGVVAGPGTGSQCGKRPKSACAKDSDCCNGRCVTGLANKDGKGRCRCVRRNKPCTADKDCCARGGQSMVCLGGICTYPCTRLGQSCDQSSVCCAGACGGVGLERGGGFTCCLATSESGCTNDSDCCEVYTGQVGCVGGVCASTCVELGSVCTTTDTCCAGTCAIPVPPSLERGDPTRCCIPLNGNGCSQKSDCCIGAYGCFSGQCLPPPV